ncbi:DUF2303 family protein [Mycobacterium sp. CBMA293]|uniref:DUF2303 family protein n=1 Tax=unclassified Mycolicibacterium TaxID=2636767 RepID=UPI0012DCAF81|nr:MULTISPECIES: DUF2303 family protein [unclassified Mycolicibacterium]MUL47578.1 DUF2303 family protein [Mycolicibacterium sp. CBMA 360]MUL61904.1 DUF2303 family protein [Mycolicibacterium sp. CBMA 335]MUL68977.1 DUF2303 family protein [Mycolicibacterium sp. CBMA 311]MUL92806.1 DUF2303 family protein [Mycolicibacterium sp. CBMA 230]MUM08752.1 hypothetical protein [Mycolicibacterium sp. CBMA 213]
MAQPEEPTVTGTITLEDPLFARRGDVFNTPHEAKIITTGEPHTSVAVAVTDDRGLEVSKIVDDERSYPEPWRASGTRTVTEMDSFLAELKRRPLPDNTGTLWGNAERGAVRAIYNDHAGEGSTAAGWRDDILELKLKADADWIAWHQLSDKYMNQTKFGDLIEELRHTISSPDQADLLEIIDSVRTSTNGEFESGLDRANGSQKLSYKKEVSARAGAVGRELEVPQTITLQLRPWDGHPTLYPVHAYFRLDVTEGQLKLAVKLFPTGEIVRQAWAEVTARVTADIGMPVLAQP